MMHAASKKDSTVSSKQMTAAQKAADEVLPYTDFLLQCCRWQNFNHWEYTQYIQALSLLGYISNLLEKLSRYEIEWQTQCTMDEENYISNTMCDC